MEEENLRTSLADITESVVQPPQQESWTSVDHQCFNGEQDAVVWGDTEVHINQTHEVDGVSLSPKAGQQTPEEAEQWEELTWPRHSITCTSPPLSFATVQWDVPDASAETPLVVTDSSLANELCSGGMRSPDSTSPSLCQPQDVTAELFEQDDNEEEDEFDSRILNSDDEWTGNYSEPCDAADVNERKTQEKEDSAQELLDSNYEVTQRTDSEEDEELSVKPSEDLIDTVEVVEGSENDVGTFVDVKLEEEPEEDCNLLTGQEDTEEGQTSVNGVKTEEENKVVNEEDEEEQFVTNVSSDEESEKAKTAHFLTDVVAPEEPLQTDSELNTLTDKLIDLQEPDLLEDRVHSGAEEDLGILERLHEDLTDQTEEIDMCEDMDENVEPDQLETANNDEETLMQEAECAPKLEDSQEEVKVIENLEDTNSQDRMASLQPDHSEELEMTDKPQQIPAEVSLQTEESDQSGQSQEQELTEETAQPEKAEQPEESTQTELTVCVETEDSRVKEPPQQTEPSEQDELMLQTADSSQLTLSEQPVPADESETAEQLSPGAELKQQQAQEADLQQGEKQAEMCDQAEDGEVVDKRDVQIVMPNGEQHKAPDTAAPYTNGEVDREMAHRLAEQLFKLDGILRADVVKHLDKNNDFSHAVGEEYLKFFDFTGQTLDQALRSFLKVVILIGETQERERVLQHFSCRFHQCNPDSFITSGAVLALTCALMLLNTDLHGQNVGKLMSSSKFVSNLDGMNEGGNFSKDLLKSLYNSIKSEPLEWAVDEEELKNSVLVDDDTFDDAPLRSKANPFLDVPHDKKASVVKQGFLQRKLLADIDGKRTPWGKRSWKTFYGVLKGMVLYLHKDDYRRDHHTTEEVVSVHHSLAEQAADYTKKPHVFRLQTADWRVFLFQASSKVEMNSWISRINLVSALHSSPPFPAAVGSQRRFCRPILPASQSAHTLERQLQSHTGMLESFKADILYQQENPPEGKKAKARDLEEHRVRTEYLHHEMCRYEIYIQVLEAWKSVEKTGDGLLSTADLNVFDKAVCADSLGEEDEEEGGLKKSHSSPSLELELAPPTVIKVKRNISERRTYRRTIVPRLTKET